jgi:farnesyl-diphosphate farnesyltransferase
MFHDFSCRMFWPKEIWGKYAEKLADFNDPTHIDAAVKCLNHMVTDGLRHVEPALNGMPHFTDKEVFRALSILLVTALGQLSTLYNNPNAFRGVLTCLNNPICLLILAAVCSNG